MPEGFFRYVAPARVAAYIAIGWQVIGSTRSPHDAQRVAIMEWPAVDEPLEPTRTASNLIATRAADRTLCGEL